MTKRIVHYVLSTHWDREWYQTFQDYRERLVRLLDRTIDAMRAGTLRGPFTADGQAIVLEDYLEVRASRDAEVRRLVADGKIVVGPWYVLPDEWLVSGESLIRNLRLGRQIAREFGGAPSDAGFVCDLFGHIGQMPQLLAGFGVRAGLVWRGLEPRATAHLNWRGSDGTTLPCFRFGRTGYCDFSYDVRHSHEHNVAFDAERARRDIKRYIDREAARGGAVPPVLLFDGGDHLEFDADVYEALMAFEDDAYEIRHTTLDAYLDEMREHAGAITDTFDGEMREVGRLPQYEEKQWLIPGVLSSRVWIKQANAECQSLLCHAAEPLGVLAERVIGRPFPAEFLDVAWRWLLKNHPHDSICGCSIDAVHEDMKYRFAQSRQIAQRQADDVLRAIACAVDSPLTDEGLRVTLFNPLPRAIDEVVELTLQVPTEWPAFNEFFGFEPKPAFHLFDATSGVEMPYQRLRQAMNRAKLRVWDQKYPQAYRTNDVRVAVRVTLPAGGYATLDARAATPAKPYDEEPAAIEPTRWPTTPGLATSERSMENALLSVTIESNGTLTITDKRSKQTYARQMTFEDIADIGDGWFHGIAVNDQCFVSSSLAADVALVNDGPLLARFRVRQAFRVPAAFDFAAMTRSAEFATLAIDSLVTLRAGADRIEVECRIDNAARDHRVRVLFPSGADAATYFSDGAFDVVERPVALPADNHKGRELAVETRPQQSWTGVEGGRRGLAVVSAGLMEATVRDLPERPVALTLFRSTRKTVMTDGEPNGQLIGPMTFRFWIVPGAIDRAALCDRGTLLAAGIRDAQVRPTDAMLRRERAAIPPRGPGVALDGDAVITSVRRVGGATEVRLFNPGVAAARATVTVPAATAATRVDLESNAIGDVPVADNAATLSLRPKEIATVRFVAAGH